MAKAYSQYKVNELKEILRERGLSLNGTKSESIARLEENDASNSEAAPENEEAAESSADVAEPASEPAPETSEPATSGEAASEPEKTEEASSEPAQRVTVTEGPINTVSEQISDEDLMRQVKEDINKQIARTKRFGGDPTPLEQRLNRINKFGIDAIRDAAIKAINPLERKRFRKPKPIRRRQVN